MLLTINIFCKAKNINQEADLLNSKSLINLLSFDLSKFRVDFIYLNKN